MKLKIKWEANRDKYADRKWARTEKKLIQALEGDISRTLQKEFERTVEGWEHKPTFISTVNRSTYTLIVQPSGPYAVRYAQINDGVKGHMIYPKRAKMLAFQPGYAPHTTASGRWGGSGTRSGDTVFARSVSWPGIEARDFVQKIKDRTETTITRKLSRIVDGEMR